MSIAYELRRRGRDVIAPMVCALAIGYFGYHAVQGDRGLVAWLRLSHEITLVKADLAAARAERETLEHRVALLRPDNLDRDMLDERARVVLGLAHPDEVVFLEH